MYVALYPFESMCIAAEPIDSWYTAKCTTLTRTRLADSLPPLFLK